VRRLVWGAPARALLSSVAVTFAIREVESSRRERTMLRIGHVAARSSVSVDTLRYYERLGLVPKPARTQSGYRLYEERVVERI